MRKFLISSVVAAAAIVGGAGGASAQSSYGPSVPMSVIPAFGKCALVVMPTTSSWQTIAIDTTWFMNNYGPTFGPINFQNTVQQLAGAAMSRNITVTVYTTGSNAPDCPYPELSWFTLGVWG